MYKIINFLKFAEEDHYNEGCDPDTGMTFDMITDFEGKTIDEVLHKVRSFFGVSDKSISLNACGEDGRIDIQIMENKAGEQPTKYEIDQWEKGDKRMWSCTYSGTLLNLTPCAFDKPIRSVERYAYINTSSSAGKGEKFTFNPDDVTQAYVWVNSFGNPTYSLFLKDGTTLLLVDDYGAMNDINHISARTVQRKKDLF